MAAFVKMLILECDAPEFLDGEMVGNSVAVAAVGWIVGVDEGGSVGVAVGTSVTSVDRKAAKLF